MRRFPLFLTLCLVAACQQVPAHDAIVTIKTQAGKEIQFWVEVMDTPAARQQGLQHRKQLPANAGMLFVWPEPQQVGMWMKNTYIPLDMLFIRAHKIVHMATNTTPHSLAIIHAQQPVDAVLEVNAGQVAERGIKVGQKIEVIYPDS